MNKRFINFMIASILLLGGCNKNKMKYVENYELNTNQIYTGQMVNNMPEGQGVLLDTKENTKYEGEFKNGLFHGQGLFKWIEKNDVLDGTFENGYPIEGKYTFSNSNYYEGEFNKDWKFHGKGLLNKSIFNEDGTVNTYGILYEGEFKNGNTANCFGKITFDQTNTNYGCIWFEGEMNANQNIAVGQTGEGLVRYDDNSTYVGDLYVKSTTNFIRQGKGTQYFEKCTTLTSASFGGPINVKLSKFNGEFDGVSHGWIFGNGIVYFDDENGNPVGYISGNWEGTDRIGDWVGRWKKDYILEEYRNTALLEHKPVFERRMEEFIYNNKDIDMTNKTLLIGTSWFDFWKTSHDDLYPTLDSINFGIGGSGPIFWSENIHYLEGLKNAPKNIIYIPGGNDVASRGEAIEDTVLKTGIVVDKIKRIFPETNIYICSFGPSPLRWYLINQFIQGNELLTTLCEENNVNYFDFTTWLFDKHISNGKYYLEGYGSLKLDIWTNDNLHFNEKGYQLITSKFIEYFSKDVY